MKFIVAFALLTTGATAFLPASRTFVAPAVQTTKAPFSKTSLSFGVDPSHFHDLPQHFDSLQNAFSTFSLSDAAALAPDLADGVDGAVEAATDGNGWFGFLVGPISGLLVIIHSALEAAGLSANAWGISIIILTLSIKALTFPLTKTQLEGTSKMQAMQPAIKELQAKYQSNPEVMNQKIAEFYKENEINPLAGCIPSLVQIPVFIGLYRSVLTLAKENRLDEGFLWLPTLEGPTFGADPAHGSDWILKGWVDGIPSLGWSTTIAYLILPLLLVASQFASMQLMQPKQDPNAEPQPANAILKFLPLMIGWFSLNVPSALCIYWITNNVVTTASSVFIRNNVAAAAEAAGPVTTSMPADTSSASTGAFSPPREKPSGFGSKSSAGSDGVKPITSIDAEIEEPLVYDDDDESSTSSATKQKRGKKSKKGKN